MLLRPLCPTLPMESQNEADLADMGGGGNPRVSPCGGSPHHGLFADNPYRHFHPAPSGCHHKVHPHLPEVPGRKLMRFAWPRVGGYTCCIGHPEPSRGAQDQGLRQKHELQILGQGWSLSSDLSVRVGRFLTVTAQSIG